VTPSGQVRELPLRQVGPGRFTGEFDAGQPGAYLANVTFARAAGEGGARSGSVQAAVSVPYPAEYRAVRDDAARLRAVAERTGGRVLRLQDAATWELFDRSDLGASRSARALWELAAILAAVLILFDVAWRRIAFDARDARELAARVTGGAASGGSGGVDALRRARSGAATGPARAAGGTAPGATGSAAPSSRADASTRFEAAQGAPRADARDLAGESVARGESSRPAPAAGDAQDGDAPADSLARLRAARRRAQERTDGEPPAGGPGGGT
jgi:hypothetical protein